MSTPKNQSRVWHLSIGFAVIALGAIILGIVFEGYFSRQRDPNAYRAMVFCGGVASLAALAIGMGIRGIEARANKAGCIVGMMIGTLALLTSALFFLGTILPGD
jgi:Na+/H+ antiporter NhaC